MPLLRHWLSLLSLGWNGAGSPFGIVKNRNSYTVSTLNGTLTINSAMRIGNTLLVVASFGNGTPAGGTILTYTCTDTNGNTFTQQIKNTDNGNQLGQVIFSAPITVGTAGDTITVTIASGTLTSGNCLLNVYEVQGLVSSTAVATQHNETGTLPITVNVAGNLVVGACEGNTQGSLVLAYSGINDSNHSSNPICFHGNGSVSFVSGTNTFDEVVAAGFS